MILRPMNPCSSTRVTLSMIIYKVWVIVMVGNGICNHTGMHEHMCVIRYCYWQEINMQNPFMYVDLHGFSACKQMCNS